MVKSEYRVTFSGAFSFGVLEVASFFSQSRLFQSDSPLSFFFGQMNWVHDLMVLKFTDILIDRVLLNFLLDSFRPSSCYSLSLFRLSNKNQKSI